MVKCNSHWSIKEIQELEKYLILGFSHREIGLKLERSETSVRSKISRLKLSKPHKNWSNLTKEDLILLIREIKSSHRFDKDPNLPGVNICYRILDVKKWSECLELANVTPLIPGYHDRNKITIFYIIECIDIDGTIFRKFGITQQKDISFRYPSKNYKVILQKQLTLDEAINEEKEMKKNSKSYKPKDRSFYSSGHSGYTECYIDD